MTAPPLLQVDGLRVFFPIHAGVLSRVVRQVRAVDGVNFRVARGQTLSLVGESGSGKTTTARAVLRLIEPTEGSIQFDGIDVRALNARPLRALRRRMQVIFQDPYSSLNPRLTVQAMLSEVFRAHGIGTPRDHADRAAALLEDVGLDAEAAARYPHEFSGGQRQRLGIARALAVDPEFIVADEPVSALDVSVQAQILNLLERLQAERGLTYLFIGHDLSVVRHISDVVAVMYLGRIVEMGPTEQVFNAPVHPYTKALLDAAPTPDPRRRRERPALKGETPSPIDPPGGCPFHPRCPDAESACSTRAQVLTPCGDGHEAACHVHAPPKVLAPAG